MAGQTSRGHRKYYRRWWFIPLPLVLFLVLAEAVLRLFWTPPTRNDESKLPEPIYLACPTADGGRLMVTNGKDDPCGLAKSPRRLDAEAEASSDPYRLATIRFRDPKPTDVIRIFLVGSSPIYSGMQEGALSLSHHLEPLLRRARPDLTFEVLNAAAHQYNALDLEKVLTEIKKYEPDFTLVYIGGVAPSIYIPGFREAEDIHSPLFRAYLFFRDLYLARLGGEATESLIDGLFHLLSGGGRQPSPEPGDASALATSYRWQNERIARLQKQAYRNICATAATLPGRTAFYEVVTNLADMPPLLSVHPQPLGAEEEERFAQLLRQADKELTARNYPAALAATAQALAIDPDYAAAHYLRGKAQTALGDKEGGLRSFLMARDLDVAKERLTVELAGTIQKYTAAENLPLLAAGPAFIAASSDGAPGNDLFVDITHPNGTGLDILARLGAEWILSNLPE